MTEPINWNQLMETAGTGFEVLPDGPYNVKIVESEKKMTGNGKVMFVVKMQVQDGPHANRLIWNNFVVSPESPGAMGYFFSDMAAFGLDRAYFAANPPPEQVAAALLNRTCTVELGNKMYNNQPRNEVKKIKPSGAGMPAPVAGMPAGFPAPMPQVGIPQPGVVAPAPAPVPIPAAPVMPQAPPMPAAPMQPQASPPIPQPAPIQQPAPVAPAAYPQQPAPVYLPQQPVAPAAPTPVPEQPAYPQAPPPVAYPQPAMPDPTQVPQAAPQAPVAAPAPQPQVAAPPVAPGAPGTVPF